MGPEKDRGIYPTGSLPATAWSCPCGLPLAGSMIPFPLFGPSGLGMVTAFQECWSLSASASPVAPLILSALLRTVPLKTPFI